MNLQTYTWIYKRTHEFTNVHMNLQTYTCHKNVWIGKRGGRRTDAYIYKYMCVYIWKRFVKLIVSVWHDSLICATWLTHMCDMAHSHVRHDSFTWATWLVHMCDMKYEHVRNKQRLTTLGVGAWPDSFTCATWIVHMWHDSIGGRNHQADCECVTHLFTSETWFICVCDMTCLHVTWSNMTQ